MGGKERGGEGSRGGGKGRGGEEGRGGEGREKRGEEEGSRGGGKGRGVRRGGGKVKGRRGRRWSFPLGNVKEGTHGGRKKVCKQKLQLKLNILEMC